MDGHALSARGKGSGSDHGYRGRPPAIFIGLAPPGIFIALIVAHVLLCGLVLLRDFPASSWPVVCLRWTLSRARPQGFFLTHHPSILWGPLPTGQVGFRLAGHARRIELEGGVGPGLELRA